MKALLDLVTKRAIFIDAMDREMRRSVVGREDIPATVIDTVVDGSLSQYAWLSVFDQ